MTRPKALICGVLLPLLALGTTATMSACSDKGDKDVQTMPQEQARRQVTQYAERVRTIVAADTFSQANANVTPCEGKGGELSDTESVYYIQGIYQLLIPAEDQEQALSRVQQQLQTDGLTIKTQRSFGPGKGGEVGAVSTDGYTVRLTSGQPPAMQLLVSSPCYRS